MRRIKDEVLVKRGRSAKIKGATYERKVASIFEKRWGLKLRRTPSSGGFAKASENIKIRGDLSCLDQNLLLHIECKNQKTWQLKAWIRQAQEDCPEGKIPLVILHQEQINEGGTRIQKADDFVVLSLDDFLEIVDKDLVLQEE